MFINKFLLSEPELYWELRQQLKFVLDGGTINELKIKEIAYATWHRQHYHAPDNVFFNQWEHLNTRIKEENQSFSRALLSQVARYHIEDNTHRISIKFNRFAEWQNWVANQSGLPVIALCCSKMSLPQDQFERLDILKDRIGFRCLLAPYHPIVEDYIERQGLHETHMHLNGTTSVEMLWHYAIQHPNSIVQDLEGEKAKSDKVPFLYATSSILNSPQQYGDLLVLARQLRIFLINTVSSRTDSSQKDILCKILNNLSLDTNYNYSFNEEHDYFGGPPYQTHLHELRLHISILEELKKTSDPVLDISYLLYVLCMNCFQRLLVQSENQYGFNQFQKLADGGARETFEKEYDARFHQLHGPHINGRPDLSTLEGRFAPKPTEDKNELLIKNILKGFLDYAKGQDHFRDTHDLNELAKQTLEVQRPTFRLVAHFIKGRWKYENSNLQENSHFKEVRERLRTSGKVFIELLDNNKNLKQIITGIDAAANELESPPEVFAPLFNYCRRKGITHFTYHVGEDFEHLLNGIRAIYEAITFLELKSGDRLGHATAIGIDPNFWINQVSDTVFLPQGQWLENLLFLRHILLNGIEINLSLARIESEIFKTAYRIFGKEIPLNTLQIFYENRNLPPEVFKDFKENKYSPDIQYYEKQLNRLRDQYPSAFECLHDRWFSPNIIQQYDIDRKEYQVSLIPVETLLIAQQYVQKIISEQHIVIETLPTSNVRISHYKSIKDHHVFRWMKIPERSFVGDYTMLITLGSDDTGIFVTDMRNEFYHLFVTIMNEFNYSAHDALKLVSNINENGRIYRFDVQKTTHMNHNSGYAEIIELPQ